MKIQKEEIEILLVEFNADISEHSTRKLYDHLIGTYEILKYWGNNEPVCYAGLFHSIYGTKYYKVNTLYHSDRKKLEKIIGVEAEYLAYLFCVIDRDSFFEFSNFQSYYTIRSISNNNVVINHKDFTNLIEISFANLIEQLPHLKEFHTPNVLRNIFQKWKPLLIYASENAKKGFFEFFYSLSKDFNY